MKKILIASILLIFIWACGGDKGGNTPSASTSKPKAEEPKKDDGKGVGEIKNVSLNDPLNESMIATGKAIYEMKCAACHKLGAKRMVGPGFEGVTDRRKPEWIMNMITNVNVMLEKDPEAQKLLEECLTRMPNQNVSIGDARSILEFLFQNDQE